jgi:hypothetical protein
MNPKQSEWLFALGLGMTLVGVFSGGLTSPCGVALIFLSFWIKEKST